MLLPQTMSPTVCGSNIAPERYAEHLERGTALLASR
jgi:hypothetical protein